MQGKLLRIKHATLQTCHQATGLAVVIDVLRAFTTTAYAFTAGVVDFVLVAGIDQAFALKGAFPYHQLWGESDGVPIPGFDFGNSPSRLLNRDLRGVHVIQRTTTGTRGVVLASHACVILATGLCNASATVEFIRKSGYTDINLIETGVLEGGWGDEDAACADFIEGLLLNKIVDRNAIIQRVKDSRSGRHFQLGMDTFPLKDLECALDIDCFDFAMLVEKVEGRPVLKPYSIHNSG